jgi:hypothetical protein
MQPPMRKIPKVLVSLFGVLTLLVASAATAGAQETEDAANTSTIDFTVDCDAGTVNVTTSKDLSNVKFFDGGTQVSERNGLSGHTNTFDLVEGADRVTAKAGVSETGVAIDCPKPDEAPVTGDGEGDPEDEVEAPVVEDDEMEDDGNQGSSAVVGAVFDCTSVTVSSTKDLSNVVLQFADGTVQKFDGLSGHEGTFAGTGDNDGAVLTGVWIKSGNNASGDGPGYGEFIASTADCVEDDTDTGVDAGGEVPGSGDDEDGNDGDEGEQGADKVTICHATASATNPYVIITIAKQAVLNGHVDHQDGRDIIPAFDDFPGQPVGQGPITSIEDCVLADEDDGTQVPGPGDSDDIETPGDDDGDNGVTPPIVGGDTETPAPGETPVTGETPVSPEVPTEVEGDEVVTDAVAPVTTFRPVVRPAGPVVMDQPTVMGDVTTRTVAGELPRTGSDAAAALAPFGLLLLLAGYALQRTGRRRSTVG